MAGYSKEFLIDAFVSRYEFKTYKEQEDFTKKFGNDFYDRCIAQYGATNGKKKFREYCSLDAETIKLYKEQNYD